MAAILREQQSMDLSDDPNQTVLIVPPDCGPAAVRLLPPTLPRPSKTPTPTRMGLPGCGLNPLVRAANPLLALAVPLRGMDSRPDVEALRLQLVNAIRQFEADAKDAKVALEMIAAARYALCTLLDETISRTAWGGNGAWACNSLLVAFHNEASGGEKFFLILQRLAQDLDRNLDALELMYLCLALGLEGRYGVIEGGQAQLASLRERLQQLIKTRRGSVEQDLSPHWQGVQGKPAAPRRPFPLWLAAALVGLSLLGLQLGFGFSLDRRSIPVAARLQQMQLSLPLAAAVTPLNVAVTPEQRISTFLAHEIQLGLVSVSGTANYVSITLHGDGIFASGSARIGQDFEPLLSRIGDAVRLVPGKVLVIGHTDNTGGPIAARLAANRALSKARAGAVGALLAARAGMPERFAAEGVGETEPLAPNDSAANRARNRRVEIRVLNAVAAA